MIDLEKLAALAVAYDAGDARRVQHFMKVYAFCRLLGRSERLGEEEQNILEAAALLHDIGIHEAERKHGSSGGKWQELEGPAVAAPLLAQAGASAAQAEKIAWLIAHHHSFDASEDLALPPEAWGTAGERGFRTETGRSFLQKMYLEKPYKP